MVNKSWNNVAECLEWIKAQNEPRAELMQIIGEGIDSGECGFTVELLEAYFQQ